MINQQVDIENIDKNKLWIRNYFLSLLIHLLILIIFFFLYNLQNNSSKINSILFSLDTKEYVQDAQQDDVQSSDKSANEIPTEKIEESKINELQTISFSDITADTTNLDQTYSEPSLNVKIKYPKGWTFIDQNKKKKLDGVTFWETAGNYNPPPYIHLEVVDKDMFIENRYRFKMEFDKYYAFYNDPEELKENITQIIYLRTEDEYDFRIKLMMKGKKDFDLFQPKFWAMLKTFDFGSGVF